MDGGPEGSLDPRVCRVSPTLMLVFSFGCTGAAEPDGPTFDGVDGSPATSGLPPAWLLVIDTSESMREEAESLALAVARIDLPEGTPVSVATMAGDGALVGPVVTMDHGPAVQQQILCGATCFAAGTVPSDPGYACGDEVTSVSEEVLACSCGEVPTASCGGAVEQGLESAYQGMQQPDAVPAGRRAHIVVVTDEGDASDRLDRDPSPGEFEVLLQDTVFHAIAPGMEGGEVRCPGTATDWGVARYLAMTELTGGLYLPVEDESCDTAPMDEALDAILAF